LREVEDLNITEIKEQSKKVEAQWNFINQALDQLEAPVLLVTYPELKFFLVNKQASLLMNAISGKKVDKNSLINQRISSITGINSISQVQEYLLAVGKKRNSSSTTRTIALDINKETRYFTVVITPIQNNKKETVHIICSAFEITSSILYGKKLEEVSRVKEEFFANVSHEFRTPLTVILGALHMLTSTQSSEDSENRKIKSQRYISIIKQNCNRLIKLINNLLDVTRIDSGYLLLCLQKHDVVAHVKEITLSVSDFVAQKNIHLSFSSNVEKKEIPIDLDKIERILLNLLSNAVKFTPGGKKISVSLRDLGNRVEIRVKDTGVGIPPEKLNIIFERFRQVDNILTRKNEGSGLGLSLVKSLVDMHGGTIKVKSALGKGTQFIISLPCLSDQECQEKSSPSPYDRDINEIIKIEFSDLNLK
jgi:signal transduction histidine kinase